MRKNGVKIRITDENPTPLTRDFIHFLEYIGKHKIKLTKANEFLTRKDLIAIYELMSEPKFDVPLKNNQPGYPLLHLFILVGIELNLLKKGRLQSSMTVTLKVKRYKEFMKLTTSEQYVALLEAFWMKVDWYYLQGGYFQREPHDIDILFDKLEDYPANKKIHINNNDLLKRLLFDFENFLYYFHYFGLWEVVFDEEESKKVSPTYRVAKSILLTPLFKTLQDALLATWNQNDEDKGALAFIDLAGIGSILEKKKQDQTGEEKEESLFNLLIPLFEKDELTTNVLENEKKIDSGTYLFNVSLNTSCWRTLQLSDSHTLLDMHELIQEAFQFDDDHLYTFFMNGKKYSKKHFYNSPLDFNGPYVDEITIRDLKLREGKRFLYLFDFGDEWEFFIDVLKLTDGKQTDKAQIIEIQGEAPEQYGGME